MALIDTSELLLDPDFTDTITVVRTTQSMGSNGRVTDTASLITGVVAVVQPASGALQRLLPETSRAEGSIAVYTKYPLTQVTATLAADEILWGGVVYTVEVLNDFGNFGDGYKQAVCSLKSLVSA